VFGAPRRATARRTERAERRKRSVGSG